MNVTTNNTGDTGNNVNSIDYGSAIIGSALTIGTVPGIAANILVGMVMIKHGFLTDAERTIYRPMFNLLFGDTCQLTISFFFGIACTVQRKLTGEGTWAWTSRVFQFLWHNSWFMLSLIAVNRYLGTCHPGIYQRVFTAQRMNALVGLSWFGALLTMAASQAIVHYFGLCCQFFLVLRAVHESMIFTTMWVRRGDETNYAEYIDTPGNYATAAVLVFCYAAVIIRIRTINRAVGESIEQRSVERRRRQEQRFALQFLVISSAFVGSITLFRVLPHFIDYFEISTVKIFAFVQVLVIFNWSLNSFIFIGFNKDIRIHILAMGTVPKQDAVVPTAGNGATGGAQNPHQTAKSINNYM